jgi:hypothetical protein
MKDGWVPPDVYIYEPLLKTGDLYNVDQNTPIFSTMAAEALRTHLEMAGELLELHYKGQSYWLLNVLECVNCLDEVRTTWAEYDGVKLSPDKYVFHSNRFSESGIFKISATYRSEVLVGEPYRMQSDMPAKPEMCGEHMPATVARRAYDGCVASGRHAVSHTNMPVATRRLMPDRMKIRAKESHPNLRWLPHCYDLALL